MICFWMWGTSSSGIRTPRSPRATITASATSTMASRSATASGVSILATSIGTAEPSRRARRSAASRTATISAADRTNDTASRSTSSPVTMSTRSRSSAVGVTNANRRAGAVTPGRPWRRPPLRTLARAPSVHRPVTTRATPPSPSATRSPTCRSSTSGALETAMRVAVLASSCSPALRRRSASATRVTPPGGRGRPEPWGRADPRARPPRARRSAGGVSGRRPPRSCRGPR